MPQTNQERLDTNLKIRVSRKQKEVLISAHANHCLASGDQIGFAEYLRRSIDIGTHNLTLKSAASNVKTVLASLKTRRDALTSQIKALENA